MSCHQVFVTYLIDRLRIAFSKLSRQKKAFHFVVKNTFLSWSEPLLPSAGRVFLATDKKVVIACSRRSAESSCVDFPGFSGNERRRLQQGIFCTEQCVKARFPDAYMYMLHKGVLTYIFENYRRIAE